MSGLSVFKPVYTILFHDIVLLTCLMLFVLHHKVNSSYIGYYDNQSEHN